LSRQRGCVLHHGPSTAHRGPNGSRRPGQAVRARAVALLGTAPGHSRRSLGVRHRLMLDEDRRALRPSAEPRRLAAATESLSHSGGSRATTCQTHSRRSVFETRERHPGPAGVRPARWDAFLCARSVRHALAAPGFRFRCRCRTRRPRLQDSCHATASSQLSDRGRDRYALLEGGSVLVDLTSSAEPVALADDRVEEWSRVVDRSRSLITRRPGPRLGCSRSAPLFGTWHWRARARRGVAR
jgi:hypothetical protein